MQVQLPWLRIEGTRDSNKIYLILGKTIIKETQAFLYNQMEELAVKLRKELAGVSIAGVALDSDKVKITVNTPDHLSALILWPKA